MNITYLDENLLLNKDAYYVTDRDFLNSIRYYVGRKCTCERYDEELELIMHDKYKSELKDIIEYYVNIFKNNYALSIGKNVNEIDIKENPYASDYLQSTYPYCLFKDGNVDTKDLDSALLFFAKHNLWADEAKLANVLAILKVHGMRKLENLNISNYEYTYGFCRYGEIKGTIVDKYQKDNLYETLHALDDYDLKKYINYIMVNNGLLNPRSILSFDPVLFVDSGDYLNMLYVVEGNHRLLACKALYEITSFITLNSFNNDKVFYNRVLKKK